LLNDLNIPFIDLGSYGELFFEKLLNIPLMDLKMLKIAIKFKPDIILGIDTIRGSHSSWLLGKKCIIFDDSEHAHEQIILFYPFADIVFTPSNYLRNLGSKQVRYNGDQKIAYLHPNWFKPNPRVLKELSLKKDEVFSILRFVSWNATHDVNQFGIKDKVEYVNALRVFGRVFISAEGNLSPELEKYRLKCRPALIHDLIYYSSLYIGEGASMATEAALLGTPSIYVSSLAHTMGNLEELEKKYNLLYSFTNSIEALNCAKKIISDKQSKIEWQKKRANLLKDKIDVTDFILRYVENNYREG
jgi:hypothetical protein